MKVILTKDVYKHGVAGEIVDVANGFARNYLIPNGFAVKATPRAIEENREVAETVVARKSALENKLNELAQEIDGVELIFGRRAGSNGKLYGSVTTMDIAQALYEKTGVDINRRRISQQSLRELGDYEVAVRLGTDLSPKLQIIIVREEELAAYLAEREAEAAAEEAGEAVEETPMDAAEAISELIEAADAQTQTLDEAAAMDAAENAVAAVEASVVEDESAAQ